MGRRGKDRRLELFKLFSQNLEWIKEHPSISFDPYFSNGYICPLCFEVFHERDLDQSLENPLTLDHVPPDSLRGKTLTLTCKRCNSISGNKLDRHLLNRLLEVDIESFLPKSKQKAEFEWKGNKINGVVEVDEKGGVKIMLDSRNSNPNQMAVFTKKLGFEEPPNNRIFNKISSEPFKFKILLKSIVRERLAQIALLRIAYLTAYSIFGNGFYLNESLYKVREQILNPDKEILPPVFWIKHDFPKKFEGVNIITQPEGLKSFLIIFNLSTLSASRQFAVVLPGPDESGYKVYDFILNELCVDDGLTLLTKIEHIPTRNYISRREGAFMSSLYWNRYNKG